MKKFFYLVVSLASFAMFTSCGSKSADDAIFDNLTKVKLPAGDTTITTLVAFGSTEKEIILAVGQDSILRLPISETTMNSNAVLLLGNTVTADVKTDADGNSQLVSIKNTDEGASRLYENMVGEWAVAETKNSDSKVGVAINVCCQAAAINFPNRQYNTWTIFSPSQIVLAGVNTTNNIAVADTAVLNFETMTMVLNNVVLTKE